MNQFNAGGLSIRDLVLSNQVLLGIFGGIWREKPNGDRWWTKIMVECGVGVPIRFMGITGLRRVVD